MRDLPENALFTISGALERKYPKEVFSFFETKDNILSVFNERKQFIESIDLDELEGISEELVSLIKLGRPKFKKYLIKKCVTRWSITSIEDGKWYLLPFTGIGAMRSFLQNVNAREELIMLVSKLVRGATVIITVPENRESYMHDIFKKGKQANPYVKESFQEATLKDWFSNPKAPIFNNPNNIPPNGMVIEDVSFNPTKGIFTIKVESAKVTMGKGAGVKVDDRGRKIGKTKSYNVRIFFEDWESILENIEKKALRVGIDYSADDFVVKMVNRLIDKLDVKFDCNCPAFHWGSPKYRLRKDAINPTSISDVVWWKRHKKSGFTGKVPLCKHVQGTIDDLDNPYSRTEEYIRRELEDLVNKIVNKEFDKTYSQAFDGEDF